MAKLSIAANVMSVGTYLGSKTYVKVWDKYDNKSGQEATRVITLWFDRDLMGEVQEGDFIEAYGQPGGKMEEYQSRTTGETLQAIAFHINNPTLVSVKANSETKSQETARVTENIDTPF